MSAKDDRKIVGVALDADWMRFDEICGPASFGIVAEEQCGVIETNLTGILLAPELAYLPVQPVFPVLHGLPIPIWS